MAFRFALAVDPRASAQIRGTLLSMVYFWFSNYKLEIGNFKPDLGSVFDLCNNRNL